jgi:hypothetical protein
MTALEIVKRELSKLSTDLAPDSELDRMIRAGHFKDWLKPAEHVRYARVLHEQGEIHQLRQEIDHMKKERAELLRNLSDADQRLKSLTVELLDCRASQRLKIRRAKVAQRNRQDSELHRLYSVVAELITEMKQPRTITKHVQRDDEGLIAAVVENQS